MRFRKMLVLSIVMMLVMSGLAVTTVMIPEGAEGAGLADSPWPCFGHDRRHTGRSPYDTSHLDGKVKWEFPLEESTTDIKASPAIDEDGTIYIGSAEGPLFAINPDGTKKWSFSAVGGVSSSPAIASDGTIYCWASNTLYAINPDGTERWSFTIESKPDVFTYLESSPMIGPNETIYLGSDDGNLYAINPNGTKKWSFQTGSAIDSSPAIGPRGTIYVGSKDDNLYAINRDGTEKWHFSKGKNITSSPAIGSDGTIYIGSEDNHLYAVNPDGTQKWDFSTKDPVLSSPAIDSDGTIYFATPNPRFYAVEPNGNEKWSYSSGWASSPAIGSNGTIYLTGPDLNAINPDGTLKWDFSIEYWINRQPAIGPNGTIYVGSDNGILYAFGESSTIVSTAPQNLQAEAGDGLVDLRWDVPANNGSSIITEYKIYRGNSSGSLSYHDSVDGKTTSFSDTELTNNQTYYYQVSAVNSAGESNKSVEISATPTAAGGDDGTDGDGGDTPGFTIPILLISVFLAMIYRRRKYNR